LGGRKCYAETIEWGHTSIDSISQKGRSLGEREGGGQGREEGVNIEKDKKKNTQWVNAGDGSQKGPQRGWHLLGEGKKIRRTGANGKSIYHTRGKEPNQCQRPARGCVATVRTKRKNPLGGQGMGKPTEGMLSAKATSDVRLAARRKKENSTIPKKGKSRIGTYSVGWGPRLIPDKEV